MFTGQWKAIPTSQARTGQDGGTSPCQSTGSLHHRKDMSGQSACNHIDHCEGLDRRSGHQCGHSNLSYQHITSFYNHITHQDCRQVNNVNGVFLLHLVQKQKNTNLVLSKALTNYFLSFLSFGKLFQSNINKHYYTCTSVAIFNAWYVCLDFKGVVV